MYVCMYVCVFRLLLVEACDNLASSISSFFIICINACWRLSRRSSSWVFTELTPEAAKDCFSKFKANSTSPAVFSAWSKLSGFEFLSNNCWLIGALSPGVSNQIAVSDSISSILFCSGQKYSAPDVRYQIASRPVMRISVGLNLGPPVYNLGTAYPYLYEPIWSAVVKMWMEWCDQWCSSTVQLLSSHII